MALWKLERYLEGYELHCSYSHHFENDAAAWVIAGMCARRLPDKQGEAEQALRRAIALDPRRNDAHYNLGNLLNDAERYQEACECYVNSLAIDANGPLVWHNLGMALKELDCIDEAEIAMRTSIKLDPLNADAWCNLGLVAHSRKNYELSKRLYLHSIHLDTGHATSWINLGMSLLDEVKPEQALTALRRGHTLDPNSPDALFNLALTLLLLGEYDEGWRLYESRFTSKQFKNTLIPSTGPWLSRLEDVQEKAQSGETVLIWGEQGLGDAIQFVRYFPILQELQIPFVFCTQPALIPLFQEWGPKGIRVLDQNQLAPPWTNAPHLALLSLPRLMRSDLATIPMVTPYLEPPGPPPERLLVPTPPGGIAIGLVWASNPGNKALYRHKSMPLELLLPRLLPALCNDLIELHSLQVGDDAAQLAPWADLDGIHNWNGKLNNFSDTAHVVHQLDLLISVDTAVAHLAGALAIPTWILLPSNADFRWLHNRTDSPWYEMVRLFRQPGTNDWAGCIDQVIDALGEVVGLDLERLAEVEG
ncbi:tetratricopeptide repeat-containing glycosyltransferase family protein [Vulcanococcus sp.]|jgi:Flp pilus assembly protein TadD|uniref:tetratricopeptide repeat-containing glycosyltransferase family protein n=1 Tax=Vulcanococcus sp. TaxID=2856995 RepID=UPI00342C167A